MNKRLLLTKNDKLETPLSKDQGSRGTNSGPKDNDFMENVLRSISSQGISAQDKVEIMQQAVAKCPKISISSMGSKSHLCWTQAAKSH